MNLGENIRSRREKLKLSQEYVAEQLGVSRQAVSKWETGLSEPTASNLIKLAEIFEISLSELVYPQNTGKEQENSGSEAWKQQQNMIWRTNLIKWAIIFHAIFINTGVTLILATFDGRLGYVGIWFVIFDLIMLLLSSIWMASNHRFEPDIGKRLRNIKIELCYCVIQTVAAVLAVYYRLVAAKPIITAAETIFVIAAASVYILFINPKFMSRKLTR